MLDSDTQQFARLVEALRPWLGHVVFVGGWAHRLHRLHRLAQALDVLPLTTLDTDVALPADLPAPEDEIRQRLLANGFYEELLGDHQPPVTHYTLGTEKTAFYAEFLTPLSGSGYSRKGKPAFTECIGGVIAQKLRHVDILLHDPWSVRVDAAVGFPLPKGTVVLIPNAVAYLAQKILIYGKRSTEDRAREVLYIHDTIQTFGRSLAELHDEWERTVRPRLHAKTARLIAQAAEDLFGRVDDNVRRSARMTAGRNLSPDDVREVCHAGLTQIFG